MDREIEQHKRRWESEHDPEALSQYFLAIQRLGQKDEWIDQNPHLYALVSAYQIWGYFFDLETMRPNFASLIDYSRKQEYSSFVYHYMNYLSDRNDISWIHHIYGYDFFRYFLETKDIIAVDVDYNLPYYEREATTDYRLKEIFILPHFVWDRNDLMDALKVPHNHSGVPLPKISGEFMLDGFRFVIKKSRKGKHRSFIICPTCHKEVPLGRVMQHNKIHI